MSPRLERSWTVLASHQTGEGNRCVDIFSRPDGTFGFEEFRRDPEDMGRWTPVSSFSGHPYPTEPDALRAARRRFRGSVHSWTADASTSRGPMSTRLLRHHAEDVAILDLVEEPGVAGHFVRIEDARRNRAGGQIEALGGHDFEAGRAEQLA
jgi:hypothetical protein